MKKSRISLAMFAIACAFPAYAKGVQQAEAGSTAPLPPCNFGPYIVFFDLNDARITPDKARTLDETVSGYFNCGGTEILLTGHTDAAGSTEYNLHLSERRVQAVSDYLVSRGVPASSIIREAYGETRPRVLGPDGTAEPQNRRVEISYARK